MLFCGVLTIQNAWNGYCTNMCMTLTLKQSDLAFVEKKAYLPQKVKKKKLFLVRFWFYQLVSQMCSLNLNHYCLLWRYDNKCRRWYNDINRLNFFYIIYRFIYLSGIIYPTSCLFHSADGNFPSMDKLSSNSIFLSFGSAVHWTLSHLHHE